MSSNDTSKLDLIDTIQHLFSFRDQPVKKLLKLSTVEEPSDEQWTEKAIETLVKKLKKKRGALEELEQALNNRSSSSKCVTITRSIDGRLQILNKKYMPHLMYCKIWRWSDLQSHRELKPLKICQFPFPSTGEICINPYHYQRVEIPKLAPVMVPKYTNNDSNETTPPPTLYKHEEMMPQNVSLPSPAMENLYSPDSGISSISSASPNSVHANDYSYLQESPGIIVTDNYDYSSIDYNDGNVQNSASSECIQMTTMHNNTNFMQVDETQNTYNQYFESNQNQDNFIPIAYEESPDWATIAYYELNSRVGEIFHCNSPVITVDGYTDPTPGTNRFCLGKLSNTNRNSSIENTRRHIGKGIQLHYIGGEVYIECNSEHAIFVQSRNCNYSAGYKDSTVIKMPPGSFHKIFDNRLFAEILIKSVQCGFDAVYELTKMCTIRISFIKGWGADYMRQDVTGTPCWIEIHLYGPLKWLDKVLTGMSPSHVAISSVS